MEPKPSRPSLTLKLEPHELQALAEIVSRVGGSPVDSDRVVTDELAKTLKMFGYTYTDDGASGHVVFPDHG